ncbi:sensor histidine kinase [Psychromonas sp. PT13]|uniref:sensor histidine kinase n=1 Tax=Psychromonas sp. PT13 TaxID=3439547 RepID=UPI003EC1142E
MYVPLKLIPLKYLVLVGFLISLIPLGLFVWQSTTIQKNVSLSWQDFTNDSISSVRIAVELDSLLVKIERSTKQYLILQTASIKTLANDNISHYKKLLDDLIKVSPKDLIDFCLTQQKNITHLESSYTTLDEQQLNRLLSDLRANQSALMNNLWSHIDSSKKEQIDLGLKKQKQVTVALLGVSFITFLLLLVLSSQVVSPVNMLKKKINQLDKDKQKALNNTSKFNGPKELLEIDVQLDRLALRLTKLEMLRQSFLRHASHEFKTPLASIIESCSILRDQISGPLTPTQKEVVGILEDSTQNLKHLTEQLLDYNYLLQNSNPSIASYDAQNIIDQSRKRYEHFFLKRQQDVTINCLLNVIDTDEKLFTRIIDNLLSNAQAYGFENGKVLVKLYADVDSNTNILIVANTGPKVPEDEKESILEPFGRSDIPRHDSLPGTGLGLSIVRDCVHLLNGTVTFIDVPDFDFSVKIILPRA